MIRAYGIGTVFSSGTPEAIAAAIRSVLAIPRARWHPALARARRELIWETQVPALLAAVEEGR
jgi:hypothetical protein